MKVAVYTRVSTEDQVSKSTVENQIQFANKYVDLHELDLFNIYKEDGISGTIPLHERPEGAALIEDAKNKRFDTLLVYKLDRLGRSARVTLNSIYELESYGVQIKSMTEPFDTSNPSGRFMITMLAGVADLERETILERMWHGANRAARDGKWLGGIVPYGYIVNEDKYLEPNYTALEGSNLSEVDVITLIYGLVGNKGYSSIMASQYMNTLGIPTSYAKDDRKVSKGKRKVATANMWRPNTIQRIIRNKTYMGVHEYGKRTSKTRDIITREVPAIVDEAIWIKANEILSNNKLDSKRNATRDYLLKSLIKCSCCGRTYTGISYSSKNRPTNKAYYSCCGKVAHKGTHLEKCHSKSVNVAFIEEQVWTDIVSFVNNPGSVLESLENNMKEIKTNDESFKVQKKMLESSLESKDDEKQSVLALYRKKQITLTDVEKQLKQISDEIDDIKDMLARINKELENENNAIRQFNTAEELLDMLKEKVNSELDFKDKRSIVKMLVKSIVVETKFDDMEKPFADIKITYNFTSVKGLVHTDKLAENTFDVQKGVSTYNTNENYSHLGKLLYMHRKENNLTQQEQADLIGISKGYLQHIQSGRYNPSNAILEKITNLEGISTLIYIKKGPI